ncbi:molybdate ABC transporter substrate-binding protein [Zavarzinella formosa]|uniref:molybdate ABC transporter substrate-binding protein n=1 Tax=Zavarzinella formosa TaxID=360055 RepID=UPI00030CD718|nr:molybdate ABC transporter substrate-binding protein [Zavarzinella formosa]
MRYLPWLVLVGSVGLLGGIALLWNNNPPVPAPDEPEAKPESVIIVHVAAALRPPMEKAAAAFEKDTGIKVELRFGPSEQLLNTLKLTKQGDLFLPADDSYVNQAREANLTEQRYDLAQMNGVAIFRKDYPKAAADITWDDVFKPATKIGQANPDITAIGKLTRDHLSKSDRWKQIEAKQPVMLGTVTEALNAVKLGSVDVAIVWEALVPKDSPLKRVALPGLEGIKANVTVAVCNGAESRAEARWFAQYLEKEDGGQVFFRELGYAPPPVAEQPRAESNKTGETVEILLYAGSMLRPAVEKTINEFEKAENVRVIRVYNGCGILVGQMRTGRHPDLYIACDPRFMGEVEDLFLKPTTLSNNRLVIAVPKGNPAGLKGLKDLGKPDLKVGVGHEQQCALGAITKETFLKSGVYADVKRNVKVESPSGDLLVNQLMTGSLDAVVCYVSNVKPNEAKLDYVPVTGIPCAAPQQPVAIAKDSTKQAIAAKLIEYLRTAESKERFLELGFGWEWKGPTK